MIEQGAPTLPQQVELDHLLPTSHMDMDNSLGPPARGSLLTVTVCAVAGLEIGECSGTDTQQFPNRHRSAGYVYPSLCA